MQDKYLLIIYYYTLIVYYINMDNNTKWKSKLFRNQSVKSNDNIHVHNMEKKIERIKKEIDEIQIDISYSTRPKKLEEINFSEFGLVPIEQKDIIIELENYETE